MKEIEVKARVHDRETLEQELQKLGCVFSEPLIQKDTIYLHKSIAFSEIRKGDVILRTRDSNGVFAITLKKQLENELDNIEQEIIVNDVQTAGEILQLMDFHEVVRVTKKRIKCHYRDMEICLDEVEGLGAFIEVEKLTDEADSLGVQQELFAFLESLGIKKEHQVFQGYDTMIVEQMGKREQKKAP